MRYRRQDANGDYVFGHGDADFLVNSPAAVAQAIETRLRLFLGEYFLDTTVGMPWQTAVLGYNTSLVYDAAIRNCIEETQGFLSFVSYSSTLNKATRVLTVSAVVNTLYSGQPSALQLSFDLTGGGGGGGLPPSGYGEGPYGGRPYGA
jgi:hypothetical protein